MKTHFETPKKCISSSKPSLTKLGKRKIPSVEFVVMPPIQDVVAADEASFILAVPSSAERQATSGLQTRCGAALSKRATQIPMDLSDIAMPVFSEQDEDCHAVVPTSPPRLGQFKLQMRPRPINLQKASSDDLYMAPKTSTQEASYDSAKTENTENILLPDFF